MKREVLEYHKAEHKWWHGLFGYVTRVIHYINPPIDFPNKRTEHHCKKCQYEKVVRETY